MIQKSHQLNINKEKLLIKHSQDHDKYFCNLVQSFYRVIDAYIIENRLLISFFFLFILISFSSWIYYFNQIIPDQIFISLISIFFFLGSVYILKYQKGISNFKQDHKNDEREIKLNLESLQKQGFKIYNNITVKDHNLDYIIVGTQGIFAIKIKAYTKPIKGLYKIVYDGNIVSFFDGISKSNTLIQQAKNSAKWLNNYLEARIQTNFNIFPIVVFVGWYTKSNILLEDIGILNPEGLTKFMQKQKHEFFSEDVSLITKELDIYSKLKNDV